MYNNKIISKNLTICLNVLNQLNTTQCRCVATRSKLFASSFARARSLPYTGPPSNVTSDTVQTTSLPKPNHARAPATHNDDDYTVDTNEVDDDIDDQSDDDKQVFSAVYGMKQSDEALREAAKQEFYDYIRSTGGTVLKDGTIMYHGDLTDEEFDKLHGTNSKETAEVLPSPLISSNTNNNTTTPDHHTPSKQPSKHSQPRSNQVIEAVIHDENNTEITESDEPAESFDATDDIVGRDNNGTILTAQQITLNEADLVETFTKGGGKGGQKVNKANNCVLLIHTPTNTYVKCHATRSLVQNRILARKLMQSRLDELYNGRHSKNQVMRQKAIKAKNKQNSRVKLKYSAQNDQPETDASYTTQPHNDRIDSIQLEQRLLRHTVTDKNNKSLNKKLAKQILAINIPNTHSLHTHTVNTEQYNKHCSACKTLLKCNSNDIANCWCSAIQLSEMTSKHLRQQYTDCLCITCLTASNC